MRELFFYSTTNIFQKKLMKSYIYILKNDFIPNIKQETTSQKQLRHVHRWRTAKTNVIGND